jgi:multiple sugar transport system permease protein
MTCREWQRLRWGVFFISPWIIGFLAFTLYPIVASFVFSFTDFNAINFSPSWVGLDNYTSLLTDDNRFWVSLQNTLTYAGILIPVATIFNVFTAVLLNLDVRGRSVYRTIFFLPVLVPSVAAAMTWVWILNPDRGLINGLLSYVGIPGPLWLASPSTALLSLVLIAIWGGGQAIVIYLAGLQDIPRHLYEAAEIDGANAWNRAIHVTVPLLTPQVLFNVITLLIFSFQAFAEPFIMTGGGPADSTLLYALNLYQRAFQDLKMGYASAMAWILFLLILTLTLLVFQMAQRWVVYER